MNTIPIALTIAGSDPSGGAGVQIDLKTFWQHRVYGCSVITAITAQNTKEVDSVYELSANMIGDQLVSILRDISIKWIKVGMVYSTQVILEISKILEKKCKKNIILDPILISSSGRNLLKKDAHKALIRYLFPLSELITPNIPETSVLTGIEINDINDVKQAAKKFLSLGAKRVLIKGGHYKHEDCEDWYYDGDIFYTFRSKRIKHVDIHGSGCIFSSAIVANLCLGMEMLEAIKRAKKFIYQVIESSSKLGEGRPVWGP